MDSITAYYNFFGATDVIIITLIVAALEAIPALILIWITRQPWKLLFYVIAVNLITVPLTLFILPLFFPFPVAFVIFFASSVVIESVLLTILFRKAFKVGETIGITVALNIFSTLVGMMLFMVVVSIYK